MHLIAALLILAVAQQDTIEQRVARLLFSQRHFEHLIEWERLGAPLGEFTTKAPDANAWDERICVDEERWFLLRLEDTDEAGVIELPFRLWKKDKRRYLCYQCEEQEKCKDEEHSSYELNAHYVERSLARVREIFYLRTVEALTREHEANQERRPTPQPAQYDIRDAVRDGTVRLYRIPHRNFDRALLTKRLRIF
jgi:hypothetical protein